MSIKLTRNQLNKFIKSIEEFSKKKIANENIRLNKIVKSLTIK